MKVRAATIFALIVMCLTSAAAGPPAPAVKLLSSGKGARKVMRYALQTGTTDRAVMTVTMAFKNSGASEIVIPTIETDLSVNLGEQRGDDHLLTFAVEDLRMVDRPGVMPGVAEAMRGLLEQLEGMTGSAFISSRGVTRESSFLLPAGLSPELRAVLEQTEDSVDQMSTPLPSQAFGVGARWQNRMDLERGGIKLTQTITYQVTAIRGDRIELKVTVTQTARPQRVAAATGSYELASYKGAGSGVVTIDLRHPVPDSSVTMEVTQLINVNLGNGKKEKVPTVVTMGMTIARKN